ncbi:Alpha/beta hydrolase fold-1 [Nemania sp. FL0916]|nr:Alpha/beta hydrolase fold-1 [Nemania sp. FL0916]
MSEKKPVIVLCPGAWCDIGYFRLTTEILTKAGFTCLAVPLPSVGSELRPKDSPPITQGLQTDANAVRDVIIPQLDLGNDVVVVCHSYGGVVTSEAVKDLDRASRGTDTGAVIHLVYVAAIILDVGNTVWPEGKPPTDQFIIDGDLCVQNPNMPGAERWLAGCDAEQMALVAASVRSHAHVCFGQPTTHAGWRHIPATYVRAGKDLMPNMIDNAPEGNKFKDIVVVDEADHFAFCSAPEQIAEIVQKAAEKAVRGTAA